jgi:hypothetical protein
MRSKRHFVLKQRKKKVNLKYLERWSKAKIEEVIQLEKEIDTTYSKVMGEKYVLSIFFKINFEIKNQ